jgi:hypothetical protein
MSCRSCKSEALKTFYSEINIHFPGLAGLDKVTVLVFPKLVVCLDCGFTEFSIPKPDLQRLADDRDERSKTA